jgi:HD-GYP domain-containing protein (c-di-GMP phosphodiesterase class II)
MSEARAGMVLAQAVYHPGRAGHILLRPGVALDDSTIGRLADYGVAQVWIRYPALDFLRRYASPPLAEAQARLTSILERDFDEASRRGHARLDFGAYAGAVQGMLTEMLNAPDAAVLVADLHGADGRLLAHASNVCFLSLVMGLRLEGYLVGQRRPLPPARARRVENLGVGALLHDAGVLALSAADRARWLATYDLSSAALRRHVLLGFEMLRAGGVAPTAAAVALHHHQRFNGTGFPAMPRLGGRPAPLAGRRIHIFSRIVALADEFDRLRHPPPAPPAPPAPASPASPPSPASPSVAMTTHATTTTPTPTPVVRVLRRLLRAAAAREFDPIVFRALLLSVPAFAPGSIVRLTDGDEAVVTGWWPEDPCRPTVRHLLRIDPARTDRSSLGPSIDLRTRADLAVAEADGENVAADLFDGEEARRLWRAAGAGLGAGMGASP